MNAKLFLAMFCGFAAVMGFWAAHVGNPSLWWVNIVLAVSNVILSSANLTLWVRQR